MRLPRAAAIVVQHGAEAPCVACLRSVLASEGVEAVPVVVDHNPGRSDALEAAVAARGAYLWDPANPGFAAGANRGIREALRWRTSEGPASLAMMAVLNPDVRLAPDCLARLLGVLSSSPGVGLAGPAILSEERPETWWNVGGEILWPSGRPRSWLHGRRRGPERLEVRDAGFVCGSVLAMRPDAVDRAGGLDERYFLYFEDADYSRRVQEAGLRTVVVPEALAWHRGGGSTAASPGLAAYYRARGRLLFSRAWNPHPVLGRLHRGLFAGRLLLKGLLRLGLAAPPGDEARMAALGALDYLRGRSGRRA
ncbi:MAG: glycosyltransferase family 2 protein [Planctomycetes bacterium]|nr:glycosyltransferase family 2 protein [Planctomycetota bacterium]